MQIPDTGAGSFGSPGASTPVHGSGAGTVKYSVPETLPAVRVLQLERLLGYSGGPAVLLYEGASLFNSVFLFLYFLHCLLSFAYKQEV